MPENTLEQIKSALDSLSTALGNSTVRAALQVIPDNLKSPIVDGLQDVLMAITSTLDTLGDEVARIVDLDDLFTATGDLLEAAEGLAPQQSSTFEGVRTTIQTIQDVVAAQEEIQAILDQIAAIVMQLETL